MHHAGQRHRHHHFDRRSSGLRVIREGGFLHIEGQRFFQPKADYARRFLRVLGQRVKLQQHGTHGGVGQYGDDVARTAADSRQRLRDYLADRRWISDVGSRERRIDGAGGQLPRGMQLHEIPLNRCARGQHTVGENLARQQRTRRRSRTQNHLSRSLDEGDLIDLLQSSDARPHFG